MSDADAVAAFKGCSNAGRWGDDDELGTLNYITPSKRLAAVRAVREGTLVSLSKNIDTEQGPTNRRAAWHVMHLANHEYSSADSIHLQIHGYATTHLDALGHMFWQGSGYNGRKQAEIVSHEGLLANSVYAMREGILTRGVLLDVAAAAGIEWFMPGDEVTPEHLEAAEAHAGLTVESGDALFVHTGLAKRQAKTGLEDPSYRCGLNLPSVVWLHEREVAVYSGDCIEVLPGPGGVVELPLHQIGLAAMGLVLLDQPALTDLLRACAERGRYDFMLMMAPLRIPGGTGSPVNPIAVF
jgi:kynurenine formamidase